MESCEQGIRLVDTAANPELAVLWPAFDEPHFFSFTLPGEATPSLLDQELAIASALRLSELSFSTPLLTDEEGIPRVYQLSEIGDPGQTFGLRLGMGLDLFDDADAELDDSVPLADAPAPQLQGGTTLDLSETDLLALASAFGDDIRAAGLALPTAAQLGCWRTLLPAIADLVAEVGGRLQAGEDLLSRLPAWVPDQPASLLGGIGDGLVEISDSIQAFQDTYLEPEALVARVNALFRAADLPFELMHSEIGEEGEEMDMEHRWELAPTEELHLTRQFSLDASGFTQALAGNGLSLIHI